TTPGKPKKNGSAAKKAKKPAAKKPAPNKKVPSERQVQLAAKKKQREELKLLKEQALVEPKKKPETAYIIFNAEQASPGMRIAQNAKERAEKYRELTPSEREHYNHLANENKAANATAYEAWVSSHTPEQIRLANNARRRLKQLLPLTKSGSQRSGKGLTLIQDARQVKRPASSFSIFHGERYRSEDMKGIALAEVAKLTSGEYKALSESERKKYIDLAAEDRARYTREYKDVYGHDMP
ncbi:hypothetical protein LTS18_011604, partial [Coniosporium uncinatum]